MKVKLLGDTKCPTQGRAGDAGYDLYLNSDIEIKPHEVSIIDTGVCVEIPEGYAGLLAMRSSICKKNLIIQQPLIDSNYRGEIHGMIYSANDEPLYFKKGERLYSLYVFPVLQENIEVVDKLSDSNRGSNWAGSSGK